MPTSDGPKIVIIGLGFGGLAAAQALKRAPAQVTLVDRQNCHVFQPLLYQVATGALSPADVAIPVRQLFSGNENVTVLMDEVIGIDRAAKRVELGSGPLDYDHLIVATGSEYSYFGHEEWRARTLSLKSLADALAIRERILCSFERAELAASEDERRRYLSFAIVGGGATGVELAGALADLARGSFPREFRRIDPTRTSIYLFEAQAALLPGFDDRLRAYAHKALTRKGVLVRLGSPVRDIVDGHVITGELAFEAGTVLWAAGVEAGSIGAWLGAQADKNGRVCMRPDLSLTEDGAVHVVGDAARLAGESGAPLPALAAVAQQQGTYVGKAIRRRLEGEAPPEPFRYRDLGELATIGRFAAVADLGRVHFTGWFAWVVWWLVHIYFLIGFRNRLFVFLSWVWSTLTYRHAVRLITGQSTERDRLADDFPTFSHPWDEVESVVTEAGMESFPASDPPAYTAGTAGAPHGSDEPVVEMEKRKRAG